MRICYQWHIPIVYCFNIQHAHRENSPTLPLGPRFHAPLHNFPHLRVQWGIIAHHWTQPQLQMHFGTTLLILVLEIRFKFQINVQCAEKAISKSFCISTEILELIWHSWYTWVTSNGSRITGPGWPDKCDKTGFAAWPGVDGAIFVAWSSSPG